jgi:ABC-type enterochelin transport system permease subunit
MPTNIGPLTISGSFARFENCDKDFNTLSQTFGIHEELYHIRESTNMDVTPMAQQNALELSFDASKDTREHQIHPTDPSKTARVSNSLSPA